MNDNHFMQLALDEAKKAQCAGEVPVGAVLVKEGVVIAVGHNQCIGTHDPTAHAEMVVLRAAAKTLNNYRLEGCELFVTLEPCAMCAGAMLHARLKRVVFGAADPKTGAAGSVLDLFAQPQLNHQTQRSAGVLAHDCAQQLQAFFYNKRQVHKAQAWPLREDALRTPAERFSGLTDYPWLPHYVATLPGLAGLRLHYLDVQSATPTGRAMLCLHGGAAWSYAFRAHMAGWLAQGYRVIAPDLIGFGKSDKPKRAHGHTLAFHTEYLLQLLQHLHLQHLDLAVQGAGQSLGCALQAQAAALFEPMPATLVATTPAQAMTQAEHWASFVAPFPDAGHQAALQAFAAW